MQRGEKYSSISNNNVNSINNSNAKLVIMGAWIMLILITIMLYNALIDNTN